MKVMKNLYLDLLQKKSERRMLMTKIGDINNKLNQGFTNCNLYEKNWRMIQPKETQRNKNEESKTNNDEYNNVAIKGIFYFSNNKNS